MHANNQGIGLIGFLTTVVALLAGAILFCPFPAAAVPQRVSAPSPGTSLSPMQLPENFGRWPLDFIENQGQVGTRAKFYARWIDKAIYFTQEGVYFAFPGKREHAAIDTITRPFSPRENRKSGTPGLQAVRMVRLAPLGMQVGVKVLPLEPQEGKVHYFLGNDPKMWRTQIPTFRSVLYQGVYQGIDLRFYGSGKQLEYDIIIQPGADPGLIRFAFEGAKSLAVNPAGDLVVNLGGSGTLIQKKPVIYQEIAGRRVPREGCFKIIDGKKAGTFGFTLTAYDTAYPLVIDPILVFSTYLGGSRDDEGYGVAVDQAGCFYVTGHTFSTNFPAINAYQPSKAPDEDIFIHSDVFVTKFKADGTGLIYSTYLGGGNDDRGKGIAVDGNNCACITGQTLSTNFPINNAWRATHSGDWDAFVTKLSADGSALVFSTYLGGSNGDYGTAIAVDGENNVYATGWTNSNNFSIASPPQATHGGGSDAFAAKFWADGTPIYSSYIGGSFSDIGHGIAANHLGQAYVTGDTASSNFPMSQQAYQPVKNQNLDAFVIRIATYGKTFVSSTFLGGNDVDAGYGIVLDGEGNVFITGNTSSPDFPRQNAFQPTKAAGKDVFVTKFNPDLTALFYSTYLGGDGDDHGTGIGLDATRCAYITGYTFSSDFPLRNPLQDSLAGSSDVFLSKINSSGNRLLYSTYFGGTREDRGQGIAVDSRAYVYVTGYTKGQFPTRVPLYTQQGNNDAFVAVWKPAARITSILGDLLELE